MKKIFALVLCALTLFVFTACSTPYPGLPDANDGKEPMKGVEIYCWQDGGEWKCGGTMGTNRLKFDEEIRSLQVVTIPQMKRILEQKGLTDCFSVILVDLSSDEVVYLYDEEQRAILQLQLGAEAEECKHQWDGGVEVEGGSGGYVMEYTCLLCGSKERQTITIIPPEN